MAGIFQQGVYTDGFDTYNTFSQWWDGVQSGGTVTPGSTTAARYSSSNPSRPEGGLLVSGQQTGVYKNLQTNVTTFIMGVAFNWNPTVAGALNRDSALWVAFDTSPNSPVACFVIHQNGTLQFQKNPSLSFGSAFAGNGVNIGSASSFVLTSNVYHYLEIKYVVHASTGVLEARIDGQVVTTFSGNTVFTANSFISFFGLGSGGGNSLTLTTYYDDMYVLDGTGTSPRNNYLGDSRVESLLCVADSATGGLNTFSTQPSQSAGSHYLNEVGWTSPGTNYNFDATPNDRESYRVYGLPNASTIYAINAKVNIEKDDASARSFAITTRSNAVDNIGSTISSPSSYQGFNQVTVVDPNTGVAWTPAGFGTGTVSSAEVGVKIIS